jgi:hypothetical protein
MQVHVYSAGTHIHFTPDHGRSPNSSLNESAELIEALLIKAGYTKELQWEARIDKMLHCSSESRPIRCQGFKPFGVTMRVKPNPNATVDQLITLFIPDGSGYSAKNLFEQLKGAEKSISRHWRKEIKEKKAEIIIKPIFPIVNDPPKMSIPCVIKEESKSLPERPEFKDLKGILQDEAKLRYVLTILDQVSNDGKITSKEKFLAAWRKNCQFTFQIRTCGRVLFELLKYKYVEEVLHEDEITGYVLTAEGRKIVVDGEIPVRVTKIKELPPLDYAKLLIDAREKAQELADAGARLEKNQLKRQDLKDQIAVLQREIEQIDKEDQAISKVLTQDREAYDLLRRLLGFVTVLPVEQ